MQVRPGYLLSYTPQGEYRGVSFHTASSSSTQPRYPMSNRCMGLALATRLDLHPLYVLWIRL